LPAFLWIRCLKALILRYLNYFVKSDRQIHFKKRDWKIRLLSAPSLGVRQKIKQDKLPLMRTCGSLRFRRVLAATLSASLFIQPIIAQDKPTGAPLVLSTTETEQEVPLAILLPDGKTAKCVSIRVHWTSLPSGPNDDATDFTVDLPADNPATPIFTAQLWNASLASAMAWQVPWEGARWKILQTPVSDGTGIDAALAVGMIATSARRPYPPKTVVIGSLNPDGSLGPVSHLVERLDAAAAAGMTRVIIPSVQRFDTDASGQVVNVVRHAGDLQLECIPVDDLVVATETTMNDPLPDTGTLDSSVPKYSNDVATYIDDFAQREQRELESGLKFAPKEADLSTYPPRLAAIWKSVYADLTGGQEAYRAGQVYTAYQLFCRANGRMNGANALAGQSRVNFDVKAALAESDDLHDHLQILMNPPSVDQGGLQSAVLVAEMADWAFEINAALEGSQLVTKQAFSQRSDATDAERDRARESILFANEQGKYLLTQTDFYTGLLDHLAKNPLPVEENASHLLPQLIPAQLATARHFTDGIRASDLRDGLLFDPRLVAYVNVLRQVKADWDSHQRRKEAQAQDTANTPPAPASTNAAPADAAAPVKLNANANTSAVAFDPGDTYRPPHGVVIAGSSTKKLSDAAQCLIWVNHDCEIATLDEKYLRLNGTMDPKTHEWILKDRPKLDALLQMAEIGARQGMAFAEKAEVDPSVLAMIYEKAAHERMQGDDASALDALRNFWRCALLGNVCWQLAHVPKAQPVDLSALSSKDQEKLKKDQKKVEETKTDDSDKATEPSADQPKKDEAQTSSPEASASTNTVVVVPPDAQPATNEVVTPNAPVPAPNTNAAPINPPPAATVANDKPAPPSAPTPSVDVGNPPVAPIATNEDSIPVAPIATNMTEAPTPPAPPAPQPPPEPAPVAAVTPTNAAPTPAPPAPPTPPVASATPDINEMNIPVAPIAKVEDYSGGAATPATNAPPVNAPIPPSGKSDSADGHSLP
jgi:hypothetical protein